MASEKGSLKNAPTGQCQGGPEMLVPGNLRKADVLLGCLGTRGWKLGRMWAGLLVRRTHSALQYTVLTAWDQYAIPGAFSVRWKH